MNAYPVQLRWRILDALDRGVGSVPQVARLFRVEDEGSDPADAAAKGGRVD